MADTGFAASLKRFVPFIGYHHVLMMFIAASWITTSLLLAGCTSSTSVMNNIYLMSVTYHQPDEASTISSIFEQASKGGQIDVRSGYFGLCAQNGQHGVWVCASGAFGLQAVFGGSNVDPLNAIGIAAHFKNDVVFPGLLIGAMAFSGLAFIGISTFPGWHEEHDSRTGSDIEIKPFPSRAVSQLCLLALAMSTLFLLASALWQHVAAASAASMISSTTQQYLAGHVGTVAMALVWTSLGLTVVPLMGLVVMILSIMLLDRLTDD